MDRDAPNRQAARQQDFGLLWRAAMFPITSCVTCASVAPGLYRLYYHGRWVGEVVTVNNDALHVSHAFTESRRFVGSLRDAARWLEAIEGA
jgi:hypothetical protein